MKNLRKGLLQEEESFRDLEYLKGRIDGFELLDALGIDFSHIERDWLMCHCPNWTGEHTNGDANPSFGFNAEELRYNCFVCGGGDAVDLVMLQAGLAEDDAEKFLQNYADFEPKEAIKFQEEIDRLLNPLKTIEVDPEYPESALFPFRKIHPYLYERGLSKEVIVEHQVGFDEAHMGITIPHIFMGKLKGWQTRHLMMDGDKYLCPNESCNVDKNGKDKKVPKYKNTSNFPKLNTLYAYDQTMAHCKANGVSSVIVVESPFTALYLKSNGFRNVVATFGEFSDEQALLLVPFATVYFWPDNDNAGRNNARRAVRVLPKYVTLKLVPCVEGQKSDAANLAPEMIQVYLDHAFPSSLVPMHGYTPILREVI